MTADPFHVLGLPPDADADAVRRARRELAKRHHPDAGGDAGRMRRINAAAGAALRQLAGGVEGPDPSPSPAPRTPGPPGPQGGGPVGVDRDVPSFVVEALPAETFEALLLVAAEIGETIDDDPPYTLDARLLDPLRCWCRLEVVPDAGSSTVSLAVAADPGWPAPTLDDVRSLWIDRLNRLDWSEL